MSVWKSVSRNPSCRVPTAKQFGHGLVTRLKKAGEPRGLEFDPLRNEIVIDDGQRVTIDELYAAYATEEHYRRVPVVQRYVINWIERLAPRPLASATSTSRVMKRLLTKAAISSAYTRKNSRGLTASTQLRSAC